MNNIILINLKKKPLAEYFYFFSLLIYSLFISLSPKNIGLSEVIFIICLFFSFSLKTYYNILKNIFFLKKSFETFFFFIIVYLLLSNLFVINDSELLSRQGFRDLTSFFFIALTVIFFREKIHTNKDFYLNITVKFGWALMIKEILVQVYYGRPLGTFSWLDESFSFIDPIIFFSINYLFLYLIFYKKINFITKIFGFLLIFIGTIFFYHSGVKLFFISILYFFFIILYASIIKKFIKSIFPRKILIILFFLFLTLFAIFSNINNRYYEITSILNENFIKNNLLFGMGLGYKYFNPIFGDYFSFTHSIFLYFLLKIGLFGSFLLIIFLLCLFNLLNYNFVNFHKLSLKNNIIIHSSIPIFFSSFFYANFKSFSFWLICALIIYYTRNVDYESNKT
jgi:hypothetical protein